MNSIIIIFSMKNDIKIIFLSIFMVFLIAAPISILASESKIITFKNDAKEKVLYYFFSYECHHCSEVGLALKEWSSETHNTDIFDVIPVSISKELVADSSLREKASHNVMLAHYLADELGVLEEASRYINAIVRSKTFNLLEGGKLIALFNQIGKNESEVSKALNSFSLKVRLVRADQNLRMYSAHIKSYLSSASVINKKHMVQENISQNDALDFFEKTLGIYREYNKIPKLASENLGEDRLAEIRPKLALSVSKCDLLAGHPDDPERRGPGVEFDSMNTQKALEVCKEELIQDPNPRLYYLYGRALLKSENYEDALKNLKSSASFGYSMASYTIGYLYYHGQGVSRDYHSAYEWFKKSANQDNADAFSAMADMHWEGSGVEKNKKMAWKLYQKAASMGDDYSQVKIGRYYYNGGLKDKAFYWLKDASEQGSLPAQETLGHYFLDKRKYGEAIYWFEKAAQKGSVNAMYNMGVIFDRGLGVNKSYRKALDWYLEAAHLGFAMAQNNAGLMFARGHGVKADYKKAHYWFKKSADQRNREAMYNLAIMYDSILGPINPFEAERLLKYLAETPGAKQMEAQRELRNRNSRANKPLTTNNGPQSEVLCQGASQWLSVCD